MVILFRLAVILTANRSATETEFSLQPASARHLVLDIGEDWIDKHPLTYANLKAESAILAANDMTLEIK